MFLLFSLSDPTRRARYQTSSKKDLQLFGSASIRRAGEVVKLFFVRHAVKRNSSLSSVRVHSAGWSLSSHVSPVLPKSREEGITAMSALKPVSRTTLSEQVALQIVDMISAGKTNPPLFRA